MSVWNDPSLNHYKCLKPPADGPIIVHSAIDCPLPQWPAQEGVQLFIMLVWTKERGEITIIVKAQSDPSIWWLHWMLDANSEKPSQHLWLSQRAWLKPRYQLFNSPGGGLSAKHFSLYWRSVFASFLSVWCYLIWRSVSRFVNALIQQRTAIVDIFSGVDIRLPLAVALKQRALNYMKGNRGNTKNLLWSGWRDSNPRRLAWEGRSSPYRVFRLSIPYSIRLICQIRNQSVMSVYVFHLYPIYYDLLLSFFCNNIEEFNYIASIFAIVEAHSGTRVLV